MRQLCKNRLDGDRELWWMKAKILYFMPTGALKCDNCVGAEPGWGSFWRSNLCCVPQATDLSGLVHVQPNAPALNPRLLLSGAARTHFLKVMVTDKTFPIRNLVCSLQFEWKKQVLNFQWNRWLRLKFVLNYSETSSRQSLGRAFIASSSSIPAAILSRGWLCSKAYYIASVVKEILQFYSLILRLLAALVRKAYSKNCKISFPTYAVNNYIYLHTYLYRLLFNIMQCKFICIIMRRIRNGIVSKILYIINTNACNWYPKIDRRPFSL